MKKKEQNEQPEVMSESGASRRRFMGAAALAGVAGATGLGGAVMTRAPTTPFHQPIR